MGCRTHFLMKTVLSKVTADGLSIAEGRKIVALQLHRRIALVVFSFIINQPA